MKLARAVSMFSLALVALSLQAATTYVTDVATPTGSVRIATYRPDAPIANVLMLVGGDGVLGLQSDGLGSASFFQANVLSRNRNAFVAAGYSVTLMDAPPALPADQTNYRSTPAHLAELRAVLREVRRRDNIATWVVGNSLGGISAAALALGEPTVTFGLILASPWLLPVLDMNIESLRRPTLLQTHQLDTCTHPEIYAPLFMARLTSTPAKRQIQYTGGVSEPLGCEATGPHGLGGLDAQFVADAMSWMRLNDQLVQPPNYTALWWNSGESGWGLNVSHQGNATFSTMFNYDAAGQPMWLVSSGARTSGDTFEGDLLRTTGPAFSASPFTPIGTANVTNVGRMTLSLSGDAGTLTYSVNGIQVVKQVQKQVFGTRAATCAAATGDRTPLTNYQDLWWNEAESGWGINLTHQGDTIFATLFTYAAGAGTANPGLWLVASLARQADGSFSGSLLRTTGPAFNANPFTPIGAANITTVGTMSVRFTSGTSGTLSYTVDGTSVNKSITRQVFGTPTACQ